MTQESLKTLEPTIGFNGRPVISPTLKLCIHYLHIALHLDYRMILHLIHSQSSHEHFPFLLSQADPQVDHKSRDQALHQVSVRKLDLSQLCFSLNFYSYVLTLNFPLCFPLSFPLFNLLSVSYPGHSKRRTSRRRFIW